MKYIKKDKTTTARRAAIGKVNISGRQANAERMKPAIARSFPAKGAFETHIPPEAMQIADRDKIAASQGI
jgi:hypothetical protein